MINVQVWLDAAAKPYTFNKAHTTYSKGGFYCVHVKKEDGNFEIIKFPINNISRAVEYGDSNRGERSERFENMERRERH